MSVQLYSSQPVPLPIPPKDSRVNTTPTVFILLCPNLDIHKILKIESKDSWPQENFPWFLKDQRLCASSVHAGGVHPAYREPAVPPTQHLQEYPPTRLPPKTWAPFSPALVDMEAEVESVMFTMVNSVLSTEEAQAILVKLMNK